MKKGNKLSAVLVVIITIAFAQFTGCGSKANEEAKQEVKVTKSDSISVVTSKVESKKLSLTKVYTGSLEGEKQANIVSQLAERIVDITVKVGDNVKAGQVLVRLDKGGLTSQFYQAQSNLQNVEKNLERTKSLFESGAVSRQVLDGTQTQFDIARANFNAAKSAVEITAPISGVVTSLKFNIGDFTAPGTPIITIATISQLKLIMSVGEADMPYVTNGKIVKIYSELNPDIKVTGRINEIAKSAELMTRTFQVKAVFGNVKDLWFKPGMFAKAELDLTTLKDVLVIPREAVIYSDQGPKVYVIENGGALSRNVKLGFQNDQSIEVTEGLKPDEVVATVGMNNLKDGIQVIVSSEKKLLSNN
ncbi:MAG: efflux RND transporter periplasmic adaptor subunit [Ignavibacteria bacterium]